MLWTFNTPHAEVDLPEIPLATDIGRDTAQFARLLVDRVNTREGQQGIFRLLSGIGRQIAEAVPDPLWDLLRAVGAAAGRPPSVLLLSQEPHVPWELARIEAPLLDATAPPFLSAQADVGRWVLPRQESLPGSRQRPRQPPPREVTVKTAAVISGIYDMPRWNRLKEAEAEAQDLQTELKAADVKADFNKVFDCLSGTPQADLLHFAVHGIYDPTSIENGLMLTDGSILDPEQVEGTDLAGAPFVSSTPARWGWAARFSAITRAWPPPS